MIPLLDRYKQRWNIASETAIKPGLTAIEHALDVLDNPQHALKIVHFAGTNGKGSTLTFVEAMARQYGLSVGKFMSPCIVDVHDQIQINGTAITQAQMDEVFQQLEQAGLSGKLTDFELLTVVALVFFKQQNVDLVLLEAGMGGREDSTNVVLPIASVITSIALEHTNFLGDTLQSIALHKAGIIKPNRPVILGEMPQEVMAIFEQEAQKNNAPLYVYGRDFSISAAENSETYENKDKQLLIPYLTRQLIGAHQGKNMALAMTAFLEVLHVKALPLDVEKIKIAVQQATLAGRFEQVMPNVYFDGAHNPASVEMLVKTIKQQFPSKKIELVIGLLADKDVRTILNLLEQVSDEFYFVDIDNPRAMPAHKLYELSSAQHKAIITNVEELLKRPVEENRIRIVTGSLYLLSEIRQKFL